MPWTGHIPSRRLLPALLLLTLTAPMAPQSALSQNRPPAKVPAAAAASRGVEIVQSGGYPELRVEGRPFFVHSAAFFYFRIPRDLWERSLDRHRELGINTIDVYIPWNWHEPREGQFDFEGKTNPRRDLRALLRLIAEKDFKLIARPGPVILNEWRHGGYPEWLLERPEYNMESIDRLEGRYLPLSNLNARNAEAAAKGWMENATHMRYARLWLGAVARELAPYSANRKVRVPRPTGRRDEMQEQDVAGPLLFVQLDDDMAIGRTNYTGPEFWRYMEALRSMLESGGVDVAAFINPTDMRVSAAGFGLERPIGAMGQWYLRRPAPVSGTLPEQRITASDASTIQFFVETLKTQPAFPPMLIEYQAAWYNPGDDARPLESAFWNTLLSSRLLLAHGLRGLNYFPAQDSITPAGYSTPWTNRYYRWDAALDASGNRQFRARAVQRNAQLLELWGEFLASSHKRADMGLVYPMGAYAQESLGREEILRVSESVMRMVRVAQLAGLSVELLDPDYQPVEQLLRHALVVLPVFDAVSEKLRISAKAQSALADYARRGGTLVFVPAVPKGGALEQAWTTASKSSHSSDPQAAVSQVAGVGKGRIALSSKDFFKWVELDESFAENRARFEAAWAIQVLREFLMLAGVRPAVTSVTLGKSAEPAGEFVVTQLVSNAETGVLSTRRGGRGLLSVTNLSHDAAVEHTLEILSPRVGARGGNEQRISLAVSVPPRESLLLPLQFPLCSSAKPAEQCKDEVVAAGAELLRAERDGRTLELTFYAPTRATVLLHLESEPRRAEADEVRAQFQWEPAERRAKIELLRGPAPSYLRVLRVHLRYTPRVPEKPDPKKTRRRDFDAAVFDAVKLPLADDTSLLSYPPLLVLDEKLEGRLLVESKNYDEFGQDVDVRVTGPIRGDGWVGLDGGDTRHVQVKLKPEKEPGADNGAASSSTSGLLAGEIEFRAGRNRRSSPIYFVPVAESGVSPYQFDFDRDGAAEWVLENSGLRLIVSPEGGGTALALVDKNTGYNLITFAGALRDHFAFTPSPAGIRPERARGRYGLFNRAYAAEWAREKENTALRLTYNAPDAFPAGAKIEKLVRLTAADVVEAEYLVSLNPASAPADAPAQAFVAVNSVAVYAHGSRGAQFCWKAGEPAEEHCEAFTPNGSVEIPAGIRSMEVRNPGRAAMALEWSEGRMAVEMKHYSAWLKLHFPELAPGNAARYKVRYRVLPVE
jgi:hypothetical protein